MPCAWRAHHQKSCFSLHTSHLYVTSFEGSAAWTQGDETIEARLAEPLLWLHAPSTISWLSLYLLFTLPSSSLCLSSSFAVHCRYILFLTPLYSLSPSCQFATKKGRHCSNIVPSRSFRFQPRFFVFVDGVDNALHPLKQRRIAQYWVYMTGSAAVLTKVFALHNHSIYVNNCLSRRYASRQELPLLPRG